MKYQHIIDQMTLEEKCSLLSGEGQFHTKTVERLGIPSMYLSDGPYGVRKQAGASDHLGLNASEPATCYPTAATMANSWDLSLAQALGERLGNEAAALDVQVLLGPGLNIKRSPLGGRNFEYFSEDPYLAGKFAAAYVRGIQSQGVSACPKHYAANSQELRRMHNDSVLDERTLREIYLTGFEIAVKEGKPQSLMSAYNRINGTYANEHKELLDDILRGEWGFDGFVVTDWGGCNDRVAGLVAGNHLEMPTTGGVSDREVAQAVREGRLSEELVNQRVDEYLQVLFPLYEAKRNQTLDVDVGHHFAAKAAEKTIVLLKNEDNILPLQPKTAVAVLGDFAQKLRFQGSGSSCINATRVDIPYDCLAESELELVGYEPGFLRHGGADAQKLDAAIALAKKAQVVLLYLGLDELSESEGFDRGHMRLPENQIELLRAVHAVNEQIVVVLCGAAAVETPWLPLCKGLLHGYLGGQAAAGAMVRAILGEINPSGKLSESWPLALGDTPCAQCFPGEEKTAEYREGIFVGYRYYQSIEQPLAFPFGFGLSYTSFAYSALSLTQEGARLTVTNTGTCSGEEIVQLYIGKPDSELFRARRELKGFYKLALDAGESKEIVIAFDEYSFRYFNIQTKRYEIEGGDYTIEIGASAADIRLQDTLNVQGTGTPCPYERAQLPAYYSAQVHAVDDAQFTTLLARPIPPSQWEKNKPLQRNDTFSQLYYAKGWVGRLVFSILHSKKEKAEATGVPDLNILFIYNMPFRAVEKMTAGMVSRRMTDALLDIFNGYFFRGCGGFIAGFFRNRREAKATRRALEQAGK